MPGVPGERESGSRCEETYAELSAESIWNDVIVALADIFFNADEWQAIGLSLQVALVAVAAALPVAAFVALVLARRHFTGKTLVETAVNLPLVLPPVVVGYLLLVAFGRRGFIGSLLDRWFDVRLIFTWRAAALASAVVTFPLMVRAMRVAFAAVDPHLEDAARTLGASRPAIFFRVTAPLALPGIIAACILGFARSIGEFGATLMIAGSIPGRTRTIPLYIYNLLDTPGGEVRAARLVLASIALSAAALFVCEGLERRARRRNPPGEA